MRGAGIGAVLTAQRDYAAASRERSKFGLMVPEAFVRGIRDLGYRSNGDAIAELIDNALQAYANRIDICFGYDGTTSVKKPTQVAVIDNGHGMEPDMIRMAVMWGGTHRENDRSGLGRYGYGLPCASVSLAGASQSIRRRSGVLGIASGLISTLLPKVPTPTHMVISSCRQQRLRRCRHLLPSRLRKHIQRAGALARSS